MITLEEIYQELAAEFQARTGKTAGGSSELAVRFYAVAAQIYSLYVQGEWTRRQCFPQTATGEDLDKHAELRGVARRQAARATGTVRFYVSQPQEIGAEIPEGTVCMTAAGVRFLTTRAVEVDAGEMYADAAVTVLPKYNGVGTVGVVPAAHGGMPSQELLKEMQAYFDRVREIACEVTVFAPTEKKVELELTLWVKEEREFDTVADAVRRTLPYRPVCVTEAQRRSALAALLRIGGDSFTPEAINDTLRGCGINARAEEGEKPGYVKVYFPDVAGIPEGFDRLREIIDEILPSHVDITYVFWYNTWGMVANRHPTFGDGAAAGLSWYGLAIENDGWLG